MYVNSYLDLTRIYFKQLLAAFGRKLALFSGLYRPCLSSTRTEEQVLAPTLTPDFTLTCDGPSRAREHHRSGSSRVLFGSSVILISAPWRCQGSRLLHPGFNQILDLPA